jgi:hypothetical protein
MKQFRLAVAGLVLAMTASCAATAPAFAQAAPQVGPGPILPPTKEPPVVLWIYPKLLPVQQGETIIQDPRAVNHHIPGDGVSPDPREQIKDARTWA